mmetsp:Transcript_4106/g.7640  ORF Transcript_4106/g.7640 Transcript_4106/m.7640 type:complete len:605 (+) Transcript_4106:30-1844(+)
MIFGQSLGESSLSMSNSIIKTMRLVTALLPFLASNGIIGHASAQSTDGYCSGTAAPCKTKYNAATCTDSADGITIKTCDTFLGACKAICEEAGVTSYNSPCRCRVSPMGCTGGSLSLCDSRLTCEGFPSCDNLDSLHCLLTDGCDWTYYDTGTSSDEATSEMTDTDTTRPATPSTSKSTDQPAGPMSNGGEEFVKTCVDNGTQYRYENTDYSPICHCIDTVETDREAGCWEQCERCLNGGSLCAIRGKSNHYYFDEYYSSNQYLGSWTTYEFGEGDDFVPISMWSSGSDTAGETCFLHVRGENCNSCTFKNCEGGSQSLGFLADCSNHGYDSNIDSCRGTTSSEEFKFFFEKATFRVGDCKTGAKSPSLGNAETTPGRSCNSYTKLPQGKISYGMNDGGCFFCAESPGSSIPLSGAALSENCKQMCDSDPLCISFEVGKAGALPVYDYYFAGESLNCCLQRTSFPSGIFVDATNIDDDTGPDNCQMDSLCWTRHEKINQQGEEVVFADARNQCDKDYIPPPSNLCSVVQLWEFSDENIQAQADFIAGGCQYNDSILEALLANAYTECSAEVEQQSAAAFSFSISHTRVFHFVALIVYSVVIVFV